MNRGEDGRMVDFARERPVTPNDMAALFKVSRRTVSNWFSRGLEKATICGRVYTSLEAIQRFSQHFASVEPPQLASLHQESESALQRMQAKWGKSKKV